MPELLSRIAGRNALESAAPICVACSASSLRMVLELADGSYLTTCTVCDGWTSLPRPSAEDAARWHDFSQYFEHPYFRYRRQSTGRFRRRCLEAFTRIRAALDPPTLRGERLLDIGCDTGAFLAAAADQFGIVPVGVDVSSRAVAEASQAGIEAYQTDLDRAPAHLTDFKIITAIDLIEHVADPRLFLSEVHRRLRPSGVLYLETPNIASFVYRAGRFLHLLTRGRPRGVFERLFPRQHVQYISCRGMQTLAATCGFEVVRLDTRVLPITDIGTSLPVRLGISVLQLPDRFTALRRILICAVLRKLRP